VEAGEKNKSGWSGGWAVTILDREDAASCGRRTGLFYLAKDARRGEPQFQGKWGWEDSGVCGSGLLARQLVLLRAVRFSIWLSWGQALIPGR
jgi:hypothetical protein